MPIADIRNYLKTDVVDVKLESGINIPASNHREVDYAIIDNLVTTDELNAVRNNTSFSRPSLNGGIPNDFDLSPQVGDTLYVEDTEDYWECLDDNPEIWSNLGNTTVTSKFKINTFNPIASDYIVTTKLTTGDVKHEDCIQKSNILLSNVLTNVGNGNADEIITSTSTGNIQKSGQKLTDLLELKPSGLPDGRSISVNTATTISITSSDMPVFNQLVILNGAGTINRINDNDVITSGKSFIFYFNATITIVHAYAPATNYKTFYFPSATNKTYSTGDWAIFTCKLDNFGTLRLYEIYSTNNEDYYKVKTDLLDTTAEYLNDKIFTNDNNGKNNADFLEIELKSAGSNYLQLNYDTSKLNVATQTTYLWADAGERAIQDGTVGETGLQVDTGELYEWIGSSPGSWIKQGIYNKDWTKINNDYFTATPLTTSTFNIINRDIFNDIKIGDAIKYDTLGTRYARVSAKSTFTGGAGTITIQGLPFTTGSASIASIYYAKEYSKIKRVSININNSDWLATVPNLNILVDGYTAYPFETPDANLVCFRTWSKTVDSGGTKAKLKIKNGANAIYTVDVDGLSLTTAKTWNNTGVSISPSYYKFTGGSNLVVDIVQPGSNKDTTEAILELYFVSE